MASSSPLAEDTERGSLPSEYDDKFYGDDNTEDEVTAFHDFIAGGIAGSASVIVGHPFDTIKVSFICN